MRHWFVVLDQSQESRKAAYTAYHLAARAGDRLIGGAAIDHLEANQAKRALGDFETGARAAKVPVDTLLLPDLSPATFASFPFSVAALLFSCGFAMNFQSATEVLIQRPPFPLWFIPEQKNLRRMMIVCGTQSQGSGCVNEGLALAKRLQLEVRIVLPENQDLPSEILAEASNVPLIVDSLPGISLLEAKSFASRNQTDLLLIDDHLVNQPLLEVFEDLDCILGIYPSLSSF